MRVRQHNLDGVHFTILRFEKVILKRISTLYLEKRPFGHGNAFIV